ncbi:MAG: BLUF domain-containing protein [Rubrivivax sp.]|jgi:hypothetical protein
MSAPHPRQSDEPGPGPQLPLLHQVAYCSRAAPEVDASTVERIVATARRTNPAQGITGLLVFGSGVFFQWLEGPRDHITGLMAKILRDPRHDEVVTLSHSEEVRERLFPDWSMELVTPDQIREVLLDALASAEDEQNTASLNRLLEKIDSNGLSGLMPRA